MAYLTDGYQTFLSFSLAPSVPFKEKEVQPPGMDSLGELDTTTMRNVRWRTKQPKKLITATEIKMVAQYDPVMFDTIRDTLIGQNGTIAVTMPDGSVLTIWGWLDKVVPNTHKEGEFVTAEMTVHCSNQNNSGVEIGPAYAAP